jgi:anti-sigma regulatory factor (Ser/Thr protein kinase)
MRVHLSYYQYLRNFESFFKGFDTQNPKELKITSHEKWVNIHPAILTMIAALGKTMDSKNITIEDITAASGHYLARMKLFEVLGKRSPYTIAEHEPAGRFIPLTQIRTQDEQTKFITEMIPLLHLKDPKQADAIKYTIGELVRNVLEHSGANNGAFVAAQYYPNANTVRLGICDTGVGILRTIRRSWPASSDIDAIKLALTPGITGTTRREGGTEANAGAGLFFIKSMAMVARDYFVVYSGTGVYKLTKRDKRTKKLPRLRANPSEDKHSETNDAPNFPGTVVAIDISLDQTNEFTQLLAIIRTAYTQAVKERKKQFSKKPRFE